MAVTAAMVKELRQKTGAGIMDVKKALTENGGDIEASIDWLRTRGIAKAAKKGGRATAEGLVSVHVEGGVGVAVEVNSETDFVAKNKEFRGMAEKIAKAGIHAADREALLRAAIDGSTAEEFVAGMIAKLGENLAIGRVERLTGASVASYVHMPVEPGMGKIGALVAFDGDDENAARQIAMHVAATRPIALSESDVPPDQVERERQVLAQRARESGKPEQIIEKIVAGGLKKYFSEETLLNQKFVVDPGRTVAKAAEDAGISVLGFARLEVGEGAK